MRILEELWAGNITPISWDIYKKDGFAKQAKAVADCEEKLLSRLSGEVREVYEKLLENQSKLSVMNDREAFITGFRLGARMMLEIMNDSDSLFT